jgi:hypothetical protein
MRFKVAVLGPEVNIAGVIVIILVRELKRNAAETIGEGVGHVLVGFREFREHGLAVFLPHFPKAHGAGADERSFRVLDVKNIFQARPVVAVVNERDSL